MKRTIHSLLLLGAALCAALLLAGCPTQPTYSPTITPIYAATSAGSLYVYNGSTWSSTSPGVGGLTSVVVSGSGTAAWIFVGGSTGVSLSVNKGSSWTALASGLGSAPVNSLFLGSNLYAATSGGVSVLNSDQTTWTNSATVPSVNNVFHYGTYTYVAASSLYVYNGTGLVTSYAASTVLAGSTVVRCVLVDSAFDVIAGTDKGVAVLYAGSSSFSTINLGASPSVNGLWLDSSGTLYVAASTGLYILGTSSVHAFSDTAALCVRTDGAGTIYAGTSSGLRTSTDGGSTWTTPLSGVQVNAVTTSAPLYSF